MAYILITLLGNICFGGEVLITYSLYTLYKGVRMGEAKPPYYARTL